MDFQKARSWFYLLLIGFLLGGASAFWASESVKGDLRMDVVVQESNVVRLETLLDHVTASEVDPSLERGGIVCKPGVLHLDGILSLGTDGPFSATLCQRNGGYRISNPYSDEAIRFVEGIEAPEVSPLN